MNESFSCQRFLALFAWSVRKRNYWFQMALWVYLSVITGHNRSKSTLDLAETMNIYIATGLIAMVFIRFYAIRKLGVERFLLLPATAKEKFLYIIVSVFGIAFGISFLMFAAGELSSRLLYSVSTKWFVFDLNFAMLAVCLTSILIFLQFLKLKRWSSFGNLLIRMSMFAICLLYFIGVYLIDDYTLISQFSWPLYLFISSGFIVASYFQLLKSEATFKTQRTSSI